MLECSKCTNVEVKKIFRDILFYQTMKSETKKGIELQ